MAQMIARKSDELFKRMFSSVLARTRLSDIRDTDPTVQTLAATADEIAKSDRSAVIRRNESSVDGAEGEILDDVLATFLPSGLPRGTGTYAAGGGLYFIRPMGSSGALTVVKGTLVKRTRDGQLYRTLADSAFTGTNTTSSVVPVVCTNKGTNGNCQIGEITIVGSTIAGVSGCTNTTVITSGTDTESDQSARDRAKLYIKAISPCIPNGILYQVLNHTSSTYGSVKFASWGIYDPNKPGYATLYIDDGNGTSGPIETESLEYDSGLLLDGKYILWTKYRPIATTLPAITWIVSPTTYLPSKATFVEPTGQIIVEIGSSPAPTGGVFTVGTYTTYSGLVGEVQNLIDGTLADTTNQGFGGAGLVIRVLPAQFKGYLPISADILWATGANVTAQTTVLKNALVNYVNNTKGIGVGITLADVTAILKANPWVLNVTDITINSVASDYNAAVNEVVRIQPTGITLV